MWYRLALVIVGIIVLIIGGINKCFELMENDEFIPNELIKLYENRN